MALDTGITQSLLFNYSVVMQKNNAEIFFLETEDSPAVVHVQGNALQHTVYG